MARHRVLGGALAAIVLACALVFAFAGLAFAAEQNPECLACHKNMQTWTAPPVDRATACVKCHTSGLLGTHPYHNPGSDCGAVCHMPEGWGSSNRFATPAWSGAAGSFAAADSVNTSPEALHIIHATPRWMDDLSTGVSECDSCHAPASCSSCHEGDPSADHAPHSMTGNANYAARTPWTGIMANGIVGEDQMIRSAVETQSACASAGCHDIEGTKTRNAVTRESHAHKALAASPQTDTVALSGTPTGTNKTTHWSPRYNSNYTLGTALYSNVLNASLTTTFTGSGVDNFEILADKDPYRGQAEVFIDGVSAGTFDCYAPATSYQQVVFRSGVLSAGPHTVTVKVLRAKQAAARDYFVHVDGFRVFGDLPATIAPKCASCHPDKTAAHGTSFSHVASMTAGTYPSGRFQCNQCHSTALFTEHGRTSSSSKAANCSACHTTYAPFNLTTPAYDYTCSWSAYGPGCHQAANNQAPHTAIATAHNATEAATQSCRDCHGSDLGVIHDDTNASRLQHASLSGSGSNGLAYATDCLTCHGPNEYPTTTDCTDAACHAGSGVVSIATHPAPAHNGTNNNAGVTRTGGFTCSTCHDLELVGEHAKSASVGAGGAIDCLDCHTATYLPAGWFATPGTTNTCVACHTVGGGAPSATTAGEAHEAADYTAKHNYDTGLNGSCGSTTMSCHSGTTALLGDMATADSLHAASKPHNANCTSCHANNTSVPTQTQCSAAGCHFGAGHDTIPAHNSTTALFAENAECLSCHTGYTNLMFGHSGGGTCVSCHDNTILTAGSTRYLGDTFTGKCVDCHKAGVIVPAKSPIETAHYSETTHTAAPFTAAVQGVGGDGVVPADGKECSTCHTASLKLAHATTSTNGGSVLCAECHTNTSLNSTATVAANWPNDKCKDCHDAGAATTHDAYTSGHTVGTARGCAGSGAGCHGTETNLAKLHNASQAGGAPKYSSCSNSDTGEACHVTKDSRPAKIWTGTDSCGTGSAGCHTEKTTTNHGGDHGYTTASDHNVTAMTGCTNSGAGCHGVSAQPGNAVTDFHGTAGCMASKCHTSPTMTPAWIAGGSGAECVRCHNGSFVNAADMVALTDTSTAGHYGDTTHTPAPASNTASITAGGTASARCNQCHNPASAGAGLYAQHQGLAASQVTSAAMAPAIACAECHNYSVAISAVVTGNWAGKNCSACHDGTAGKVQPQHGAAPVGVNATSPQSCGATGVNCHTTYDLHTLHKDANGCALTGCHDYTKQGLNPTTTTCGSGGGACHGTYNETNHYNAANHTSTLQGAATYTLNGQSPQCQSCHAVELNPEHTATNSTLSGTGSSCLKCHNNAGSTTAITGKWSGELCVACHDGSGITTSHAGTSGHVAANAGCASTGIGCHNTGDLGMAGADKTVNIHNDCLTCHDKAGAAAWAYGAGVNLKYNPTAKNCGQATGCHTSGYYSTVTKFHNVGQGSLVNGDDAKHTAAGMTTAVGAYANNNTCATCHSAKLNTAHATTSLASDATCSSGGTGNLGCHNSTALPNSPTQVKGSWTNDLCSDCHATSHTTYTLGTHTTLVGTAGTADGCVTGGCHLAGATSDVRLIHDRASSGCSAMGQDSKDGNSGANAACHALDKPMVSGTIGCGSGTTAATKCHVNHTNSNHGISAGGQACYKCHTVYKDTMESSGTARAASVHHVMGSATQNGDIAPNTGTYPTSKTDVYCVSCHSDHNYFNGAASKAGNLRTDIANASGAATASTDYLTTGAYGICVSCHNVSQAKQGMGTDQLNVGAANTPVIAGADFNASAHEYSVASTFGASATFNANCAKCHSDEQTKQYATGTYKFGTHYSASAGILSALGAFVGNPPQEEACYKCHNATAAKYGETLSAAAKGTQNEFTLASKHDLSKVACANCHNVHEASAASPVADPNNTYNAASIATTAGVNTFCLGCHDGTTPTQAVNGTTLVPYTVSAAATANVAANYATEGHGGSKPGAPFTGRTDTGYATGYTDTTADWTNEANVTGAPDAVSATSPSDNAFEMRSTFAIPAASTIDNATLTVRSRALGGWGATTAASQIRYSTSDAASGNWAEGVAGADGDASEFNEIDDTAPASAHDVDATYIVSSGTTEYQAGTAVPTVPANATNISVSVIWTVRDGTTNTQTNFSRLRVNGTMYSAATTNRNPGTTYTTYTDTWATNPNGGAAWTPATVNTVNGFGFDTSGFTAMRITQGYIQVSYTVPLNDDTWAIQYTTDGAAWNDVTAANTAVEGALTDHTIDLTGILDPANAASFAVRILGATTGTVDNSGTVQWDSSTLDLTYSGADVGPTRADCRDCHEQHGSSLRDLLKTSVDGQTVASYTDTADQAQCLACHRSGGSAGSSNISQYYPAAAGGTAAASMTRSGHRTESAGTLPAGSAMPCRSCHNPHGGAGSGYMLAVRTQVAAGVDTLIGDAAGELNMSDAAQTPANAVNTRRFCFSCHTTSDTTFGWNGSTMALVPANARVLGIDRTTSIVLKLPTLANGVNGHKQADTHSCYLCHGDDFSASNSVNVHNPAAGESRGGIPCYICHTVYQDRMEDGLGAALGLNRTTSFHHVLGTATRSGDTTVYPMSTGSKQDVYCTSCHVDHNLFSPLVTAGQKRSANLRLTFGATAPATTADATNTDFVAAGGICIGCHNVRLTRDNTSQTVEAASSYTPTITASGYDASAHQYVANSTFTDGTTFNADCSKCHDSEIDGGGMERGSGVEGFQTSANKFSTHYSSARRLLGAMGVDVTDPPAEEAVCFRCHSLLADGLKSTTNQDWYGKASMNTTSQAIYGLTSMTYGHAVDGYSGVHRPSSEDETRGYVSANKHVECADCHDVHEATKVQHVPGTAGTAGNDISGVLAGASGVAATFSGTNWTAPTAYAPASAATDEYQICFKCHSGYNTDLANWGGTGAASWTDQALEFSTSNQSYHPVVAPLPVTDPGTNGSSRLQTADMRTVAQGGPGWANGDSMYCSDCHAESSAGSMGPHGSSVKWLLKGPNQAWPYDTAALNGTNTNTTASYRTYSEDDTNLGTSNGLFCRNCHVLNGEEHTRSDHNVPCVSCHIRVPHGGKSSRLQAGNGSATVWPGNLPLRYTPNGAGQKPTSWWIADLHKQAGGSYGGRETCGVSDGSCGGSHDHQTDSTDHW